MNFWYDKAKGRISPDILDRFSQPFHHM